MDTEGHGWTLRAAGHGHGLDTDWTLAGHGLDTAGSWTLAGHGLDTGWTRPDTAPSCQTSAAAPADISLESDAAARPPRLPSDFSGRKFPPAAESV